MRYISPCWCRGNKCARPAPYRGRRQPTTHRPPVSPFHQGGIISIFSRQVTPLNPRPTGVPVEPDVNCSRAIRGFTDSRTIRRPVRMFRPSITTGSSCARHAAAPQHQILVIGRGQPAIACGGLGCGWRQMVTDLFQSPNIGGRDPVCRPPPQPRRIKGGGTGNPVGNDPQDMPSPLLIPLSRISVVNGQVYPRVRGSGEFPSRLPRRHGIPHYPPMCGHYELRNIAVITIAPSSSDSTVTVPLAPADSNPHTVRSFFGDLFDRAPVGTPNSRAHDRQW